MPALYSTPLRTPPGTTMALQFVRRAAGLGLRRSVFAQSTRGKSYTPPETSIDLDAVRHRCACGASGKMANTSPSPLLSQHFPPHQATLSPPTQSRRLAPSARKSRPPTGESSASTGPSTVPRRTRTHKKPSTAARRVHRVHRARGRVRVSVNAAGTGRHRAALERAHPPPIPSLNSRY